MSELRVALVAEGPTDAVIIEAALKALLPRPFVLTLLQPEATNPQIGTGWGGVLRWCDAFAERAGSSFEGDPLMEGFDMFVLHVDADVAELAYANVSEDIAERAEAQGWPKLPQRAQCPPASASADIVRGCVLAWTGLNAFGPKTVLCVPSKAVEAWLAAGVLAMPHALHRGIECNFNLEKQLAALGKKTGIKKTRREYQQRESQIRDSWPVVRALCTQAERFSVDVHQALQPAPPPAPAPAGEDAGSPDEGLGSGASSGRDDHDAG